MVSAKNNINIDSAIVRIVHKVEKERGTLPARELNLKGGRHLSSFCTC